MDEILCGDKRISLQITDNVNCQQTMANQEDHVLVLKQPIKVTQM